MISRDQVPYARRFEKQITVTTSATPTAWRPGWCRGKQVRDKRRDDRHCHADDLGDRSAEEVAGDPDIAGEVDSDAFGPIQRAPSGVVDESIVVVGSDT